MGELVVATIHPRVARHPQRYLDDLVNQERTPHPVGVAGHGFAVAVIPELVHLEPRERAGRDVLDPENGDDRVALTTRHGWQVADLPGPPHRGDQPRVALALEQLAHRRPLDRRCRNAPRIAPHVAGVWAPTADRDETDHHRTE